jgi:hypothetical protein
LNGDGKKDENEKIKDVDNNWRLDENDYYAFIGTNARCIHKEIIDKAVESNIADLKEKHCWGLREPTEALAKLKDPRAVEPLIAVTKNNPWTWSARYLAAKALGEIGDPRALDTLKDMRGDGFFNLGDPGDPYDMTLPAVDAAIKKIEDRQKQKKTANPEYCDFPSN